MSDLSDAWYKSREDEERWFQEQSKKVGPYDNPEEGCPNCGRFRIMLGDDQKHRCEKCCWCIEDKEIDFDFMRYDF